MERAVADKVRALLAQGGAELPLARALMTPVSMSDLSDALARAYGTGGSWCGLYSDFRTLVAKMPLREWLETFPGRAAVVLFRWATTYGHWFAVFIGSGGRIEIFDSTGHPPDTLGIGVPARASRALGQDRRALVDSLAHAPAFYNDHALQAPDAQTCGRWCLLRLALRGVDEDGFAALVLGTAARAGRSPDLIVTAATFRP